MKNNKEHMKEHTKEYINKLISSGAEKVTERELNNILYNYGLKIDPGSKLKYYNTANTEKFLHCTCSAVDENGKNWANLDSIFYKKEIIYKTEKYKNFKEDRNTFFAVLKTGHILEF